MNQTCMEVNAIFWNNFSGYNNQTLINFMSLTRKGLERRHLMGKLEQVKFTINPDLPRSYLNHTAKKEAENSKKSKSKDKTIKIGPERTSSLREPQSCKNKNGLQLDRSKESKESRESLMKSTHSYYIAHRKEKRSGSAADKPPHTKSKELTNNSHLIHSTFEMQSLMSTHKKKKSNFSSTIGSKFDFVQLNKSALNGHTTDPRSDSLSQLLAKSQGVLQHYRSKYQALQRENRRYKKKYQQALKKIKHLENKF